MIAELYFDPHKRLFTHVWLGDEPIAHLYFAAKRAIDGRYRIWGVHVLNERNPWYAYTILNEVCAGDTRVCWTGMLADYPLGE